MSTTDNTNAARRGSGSNDMLGLVERLRRNSDGWLPTNDHTLEAHNLLEEAAEKLAAFHRQVMRYQCLRDLLSAHDVERLFAAWDDFGWAEGFEQRGKETDAALDAAMAERNIGLA